jgi:hypothetical protein
MNRIATNALLMLIAGSLSSACAQFPLAGAPGPSDSRTAMTQDRMELLFSDEVDAIVGPPGAIQTQVDGINVYLISDIANDRMRIVAPVAMAEKLSPRVLDVLLRANFHSTLDARYAIADGVIYAAFLHPISSLSPELLKSALSQVLSLAKTFGSTFSSGELQFGVSQSESP